MQLCKSSLHLPLLPRPLRRLLRHSRVIDDTCASSEREISIITRGPFDTFPAVGQLHNVVGSQEQECIKRDRVAGDDPAPSIRFSIRRCRLCRFRGVHLGKSKNNTPESVRSILLQEVLAYVDEGAGSAVVGEFVDKGLGLLNKAFDGG
jgi:hypothetical protein